MAELVDGKLGNNASYSVDFINGDIIISGSYDGAFGEVTLDMALSLLSVLELAAKSTDNTIDDSLVALLSRALGDD